MATRKKATKKKEPTFAEGYQQCAKDILEKLDALWFHTPRAIRPGPLMDKLRAVATAELPPEEPELAPEEPAPDPEVNARVEGESAD